MFELKRREDSPYYHVDFKNAKGKRVRKSTRETDKAKAEAKALQIVKNSLEETQVDLAYSKTLSEALDACYENVWSLAPRSAHEWFKKVTYMKELVSDTKLIEVTYEYLIQLKKGWKLEDNSAGTINKKLSLISRAMSHVAKDLKWMSTSDIPSFPREAKAERRQASVNRKKTFSDEDEKEILNTFDRLSVREPVTRFGIPWQWYKRLFIFLLETGCRPLEPRYLKWEWFTAEEVFIPASVSKTDTDRTIGLTDRALEAVSAFDGLVDDYPFGWLPDSTKSSKHFKRVVREAGLGDGYTLYSCRHTYGTRSAPLVTANVLMALMGHSNIQTTSSYYVHLEGNEGAEILRQASRLRYAKGSPSPTKVKSE